MVTLFKETLDTSSWRVVPRLCLYLFASHEIWCSLLVTIPFSICTLHILMAFGFFYLFINLFLYLFLLEYQMCNYNLLSRLEQNVLLQLVFFKLPKKSKSNQSHHLFVASMAWRPQLRVTAHGHTTEHMSHDKCHLHHFLIWVPVNPPVWQWERKDL